MTSKSESDITRASRRAAWRRSRGFTLIELLVVVAIISLLVSILLPSLTRAKELAMATECMSKMRSIGIASHVIANDMDDYMPGGANAGGAPPVPLERLWFVTLAEQADMAGSWPLWNGHKTTWYAEEVTCPSGMAGPSSYGPVAGHATSIGWGGLCAGGGGGPGGKQCQRSDVFTPSETPYWLEMWNGAWTHAIWAGPYSPYNSMFWWDRHLDESNVMFVDGHGQSIHKDFWYANVPPPWNWYAYSFIVNTGVKPDWP